MISVTLNNGLKIPQIGIGTFNVTNEKAKADVLEALKNGCRHIDTAHAYFDEQGVGEAMRESGVKREEIWLTSKLWPSEYGEGKTMEAIDKMLARLQTETLDLLCTSPSATAPGHGRIWKRLSKPERCVPLASATSISMMRCSGPSWNIPKSNRPRSKSNVTLLHSASKCGKKRKPTTLLLNVGTLWEARARNCLATLSS